MTNHTKPQKTGKHVVCTKCHRLLAENIGPFFIGTMHGSGGANHCGGTFERTDERPADAW